MGLSRAGVKVGFDQGLRAIRFPTQLTHTADGAQICFLSTMFAQQASFFFRTARQTNKQTFISQIVRFLFSQTFRCNSGFYCRHFSNVFRKLHFIFAARIIFKYLILSCGLSENIFPHLHRMYKAGSWAAGKLFTCPYCMFESCRRRFLLATVPHKLHF